MAMENTKELLYLIRVGTETRGPYNIDALETLALNGTISTSTLVAQEGSVDFKTLDTCAFFNRIFPARTLDLAKAPATFVTVNATRQAPLDKQDWTLRIPLNQAQAKSGSTKDDADPNTVRRGRLIDSMKEWDARIAADPSDPIVIASMNEIGLQMQRDGMTRKRALKQLFAGNREINRQSDQRAQPGGMGETPAQFRSTATKYAIVLAAVCAAFIYFYPSARPNGQVALEVIGAIYGICWIAARWIVRMHPSFFYLMTALQLYVFGWLIWVIVNVFRDSSVGDPFQALFNGLVRWHL
jgi:hypothetical protein